MGFSVDDLLKYNPFDYNIQDHKLLFMKSLQEMAIHHFENCQPYKNFCSNNGFDPYNATNTLFDYPYLPVNIFKEVELISVDSDTVVKKIESSATTSGIPSKVHVDLQTSKRQIIASSSVMKEFLHPHRHQFFILDANPTLNFSSEMSARIAATRGFLILAKKYQYFMGINEEGKLELEIDNFIEACHNYSDNSDDDLTIFGFTFIIYEYVVKKLLEKNIYFTLPNVKLAHIGGWKKLINQKVSPSKFKNDIFKALGIPPSNIIDFYGFTEQMGIIYGENKNGVKISPAYSEVIIRDIETLEPVSDGKEGFIQTISPIFSSFPGISVLTEDIGKIIFRNKSKCGRLGTGFQILGRAKESEVRGCGDLMQDKMII